MQHLENDEKLQLARRVITIFEQSGAKCASHAVALLRPWLKYAYGETVAPKEWRNEFDHRKRQWLISLQWYCNAELVAESDGLRRDTNGVILNYGGDMVTGLDGAAELVAEYATQIGAPAEFAAEPMRLALANLRPTISRQGGRATMRRVSECRQWNLVAHVFREDALPRDLSTIPSTLRRKIEPATT